MSSSKKKSKAKPPRKARAAKKPAPKAKSAKKKVQQKVAAPAPPARPAGPHRITTPHPAPVEASKPAAPKTAHAAGAKKSSRRSGLLQRRGPGGELLAAGEILIPTGPQTVEEVQYFFRGCVAAEHPAGETGAAEILAKRTSMDPEAARAELTRHMQAMVQRFGSGSVEPLLPIRPPAARRTFPTVVERAKLRRREIGAFLRGLDLGRTETSHMDSHGEASLQTLMEWAARLEILAEADEPEQADYARFHQVLDQLENTTEALIVDVEATLRRLRDRVRSS